jgi:hypothetical protein
LLKRRLKEKTTDETIKTRCSFNIENMYTNIPTKQLSKIIKSTLASLDLVSHDFLRELGELLETI